MGMDLYGKGGDFWFSIHAWHYALELAHEHGWEPAGTEAPDVMVYNPDGTVDEEMTAQYRYAAEEWSGDYFSNSRQWVTEEDAANIADALEQALDHIPKERTVGMEAATIHHKTPTGETISGVPAETGEHLGPYDWYSGEAKQKLRDFITFCRAGAFSIG